MPEITFVQPDGRRVKLAVRAGDSAMLAALRSQVRGIIGECGGSMACATCHVYVDDAWLGRIAPVSPAEDEMLGATAAPRRANSRLACQIEMSDSLDGIVLEVAEAQL
ncbi:2Fe-2S iron-sulfur cluster-binding protein [Phreatobacter stygius]|uniref:2Fe-2S iron-sulfur cluster binding domain-containing protein n=1 Tax=Phreatobacter stygius TaxID=1940610 RepID=A0A4D7BJD5_9HYPH|nr:2Fe-2S iron-sulfur cluster-binding protein [Phreatobacter stygius]QCI67827.1 2Fe-2S iron-sulfur cluster binding domain-containing protein [Phreatobacter stygius]